MAREAYRSLYSDLTKLQDYAALNYTGATSIEDELFQLLLAVSEAIDLYCDRHFYPFTTTRYFDLDEGRQEVLVPDLIAVTTLKDDENQDATYENTWASTAYQLLPANAEPTKQIGRPYTAIRVNKRSNDTTRSQFPPGQRVLEIAGKWGYREFKEDSKTDINNVAGYSATDTSLVVDLGSNFKEGQTIIIGSEQLLITSISTHTLTVTRGLNGTTAASIADNADVYILRWPAAIERAATIQTVRIFGRAPLFEPAFVDVDLDTDIRHMLDPYRRIAA